MKTTLLLALLTASMSLVAMERTQKVSTEEGLQAAEKIKLVLQDEHDPETTHEVELPLHLAKLIGSLRDLLENPEIRKAKFPLPNLTSAHWRLIEPQLERVHGITHDVSQAAQLRKGIIDAFQTLDGKNLTEVIYTADYLGIPLLQEIGLKVAKSAPCDKFSWDQISLLHWDMRNSIMLYQIMAKCGPKFEQSVKIAGDYGMLTSRFISEKGRVCSGYSNGTISVCALQGDELSRWQGHSDIVRDICVINDNYIVTASNDKTVRAWNMWEPKQQLGGIKSHDDSVSCICLSNDWKIISGSLDKTIRVWQMWSNRDNNPLAVCRGHDDSVSSVCVTNDGEILSGSYDKTVRVWNMKGNELAVCSGHEGTVNSVCSTNNGKIASGSSDRTVRVWNTKGKELAVCRGHEDTVNSVCPTNDGKIISCSDDKTVRMWDTQGNELAICTGYEAGVVSAFVTNDGMLVSASKDKTVRVWNIRLIDRILRMDDDQAQAFGQLLHSVSKQTVIDKVKIWQEIEKILGVEPPADEGVKYFV